MLARHRVTGQLVDLAGPSTIVELNEVVYDGLGNPVGIAPILAALAPMAKSLIPSLLSMLPSLTGGRAPTAPPTDAAPPPPPPSPPPEPQPPAPAPVEPEPPPPMRRVSQSEPKEPPDDRGPMSPRDPGGLKPPARRMVVRVVRRPLRRRRRVVIRRRPLGGVYW